MVARSLLVATLLSLCGPSLAHAVGVLSPRDGDRVPAQPIFHFDFANGVAEIELSRNPDTRTAGENAGSFVDQATSEYFLLYIEPRNGIRQWGRRIDAGRYYWHARFRDDSVESPTFTGWTPSMRLTVADEPIVFEGWLVRARRLRSGRRCRSRVRVSGKFVYDDNARRERAKWVLRLAAGRRHLRRFSGNSESTFDNDFAVTVCTRRRVLAATLALRDSAGHISRGAPKQVAVR